jgi:transcriptional regulator with GAF, ATPase, and Fis domain
MLLLIVGGALLIIVVIRLAYQKKAMAAQFLRVSDSNKNYVFNDGCVEENIKHGEAISKLELNLKTAARFIKQITTGDLGAEWPGMQNGLLAKNSNTLAGELITMRDQMAQVKKEEQERLWVSEGITKFSEIIRTHQADIQKMSDTLISGIVKYLDCNQGGLFFIDSEDDSTLELRSCYAYDKIRFVEKNVSVGSGMIGQAFKEGEMIVLKEIPDNYVNITSGLGESLPRHLAIVPLKVNENIEGVMELASFTEFTKIKIELLDKISEIVASAVFNSRNAAEMKRLLQEAEENAAAMRAQEEEMRQNMEELQAMHENAERNKQ